MAPLGTKVTCKSRTTTFNTETEQQWKQNQQQLLGEDFVNTMNFFHNVRKPELRERWNQYFRGKPNSNNENQNQEKEDNTEDNFELTSSTTTRLATQGGRR
jgi:hypothetical protein